jgi:DNA polymerase-3 subunit gamma/tau
VSQTLYRKYRSQRFAEIIGQGSVVRILRNSIERGRLNHAYLFSGPRGTGKTSIARIFAKALNCLEPIEGDACGVCAVCVSIAAGNAVDVIEIDAASNRGIDDIRDLRDRVNYAPLELKRKVYIIDEVHMITGPAWNALLKTLEEPPGHVIFCLCTTEANKVPITILSRCIRFDFQRLPFNELASHLESIARTEGFTLEQGCGLKLAQLAEGSARDAISLLDQLTVYCESVITSADIDELFQLGDPGLINEIADRVLDGDSAAALTAWAALLTRGIDAGSFLLQLAEEIKARFLADANPHSSAALAAVWQGLNLLKYDSFPALLVELTLIQASGDNQAVEAPEPNPARSQRAVQPASSRPLAEYERRPAEATVARPAPRKDTTPEVFSAVAAPALSNHTPLGVEGQKVAVPQTAINLIEPFREKVRQLRMTTFALLLKAVSAELQGNSFCVTFGANERQALAFAGQKDTLGILREAARQLYGQHTVLLLRREGDEVVAAPADAAETEVGQPQAEEDQVAPPTSNGSIAALESSEPPGDRSASFDDAVRLFPLPEE